MNQEISKAAINTQKMRAAKFAKVGNGAKVAGNFFVVGGVIVDVIGMYNYTVNPESSFVVTPEKAGVNTSKYLITISFY
jgi:hypothetical protein